MMAAPPNHSPSPSEHAGLQAFPPNRQAAVERLAAVDATAYAQTRNHLNGAVTRLSPYITHGLLTLPEVFDAVHARTPMHPEHRLVMELGWRAYHHQVWADTPEAIHQSRHPGPLPDAAYHRHLPPDVLAARTGVPVVDRAVHTLVTTGYLHNHARLWLASHLVHARKVHWHVGATWMIGHLLDGDLASNHLSWQWVAGPGSTKPYVFNADNVARFAPPDWHSPGTAVDTDYPSLLQQAHTPPAGALPAPGPEDAPPATDHPPPGCGWQAASAWAPGGALAAHPTGGAPFVGPSVDGVPTPAVGPDPVRPNEVWLLHPWALGGPPSDWGLSGRPRAVVAVGSSVVHAVAPWRTVRWRFVSQGLQAHTPWCLWGHPHELARALAGFGTVHWPEDPHAAPLWAALQAAWAQHPQAPRTVVHPQPRLFAPVDGPVTSFSNWWRRTRLLRPAAAHAAPNANAGLSPDQRWHR